MLEGKRILIVLAHPDDETLGCGGTLHKLSKTNDIKLFIPVERLLDQFQLAISILGVPHYEFGAFSDHTLDDYPLLSICKFVEGGLDEFKPDVVITHHHNCMNQDHRKLFEACSIATRPVKRKVTLLTCEVPSSTGYLRPCGFEPNLYVKLSKDDVEAKMDAMSVYQTEWRIDRSPMMLEGLARVRGAESGNEYAEGFMLVRSYE